MELNRIGLNTCITLKFLDGFLSASNLILISSPAFYVCVLAVKASRWPNSPGALHWPKLMSDWMRASQSDFPVQWNPNSNEITMLTIYFQHVSTLQVSKSPKKWVKVPRVMATFAHVFGISLGLPSSLDPQRNQGYSSQALILGASVAAAPSGSQPAVGMDRDVFWTHHQLDLWPEIPVRSTKKTPFIECIIPFVASYKY